MPTATDHRVLISDALNGTLVFNSDGSYMYTPDAGFSARIASALPALMALRLRRRPRSA